MILLMHLLLPSPSLQFPFALSVILDPELKADKMYATNAHSSSMVVYAAGYFLYDILLCLLRFNENGPSFLVHAIGCSLAFWYPMFTRHLHYFGACFLMWEISTPFLYFRWFLLKTNRGEKPIMALANNAFALAFLGCRVIFGPSKHCPSRMPPCPQSSLRWIMLLSSIF